MAVGFFNSGRIRRKRILSRKRSFRRIKTKRKGDYLEAEIEDNKIVFIPKILIDKAGPVILSKKGEEMIK